ncbi:TIGR03986 family CRISPR-associated RAMP protein [bacterium]|nr:TIGR03986 family CRISPR-associated RAMP protein [bacterium]
MSKKKKKKNKWMSFEDFQKEFGSGQTPPEAPKESHNIQIRYQPTPQEFRSSQRRRQPTPPQVPANNKATAPYNFIPLSEKVVKSDFDITNYPFNKYHKDLNTGYIEVELEAKTPLYIRDTMNPKEREEEDKINKDENRTRVECANSDFFSPAERPRIPGSSLRGLIRTMVEIVSFSKFGFYEDKLLYYRGLADKSRVFRTEYSKHMSSWDRHSKKATYKMSAGLMYKQGLKYYIIPAESFSQTDKKVGKRQYFIKLDENRYLVVSGDMNNKKHEWIITCNPDKNRTIEVPRQDINEYKNDRLRDSTVIDVVKKASTDKFVPCFYVNWKDVKGNNRISFGHTPMFRLAYQKTIGDHISNFLKNKDIDIASTIFGNEKEFAGRVFFEDSYFQGNKEELFEREEKTPKILSTPKPTSFQHYLEQQNSFNLNHYNTSANIRGYKMYWHKSGKNYEEIPSKIAKSPKQYTKIKPAKEGAKFLGRIRFENLTKVELGALLFAIQLKEGLCHKIGMGKPLGLGSVKITPKLFLSEREKRYSDFMCEFVEAKNSETETKEFIEKFEDYVLKQLGEKGKKTFWELSRLKELSCMLDFEGRPSDDNTSYMNIEPVNQFKDRKTLPKPSEVI